MDVLVQPPISAPRKKSQKDEEEENHFDVSIRPDEKHKEQVMRIWRSVFLLYIYSSSYTPTEPDNNARPTDSRPPLVLPFSLRHIFVGPRVFDGKHNTPKRLAGK